ncbi:DUF3429 domain-containing protein [Hyphobacterium sp.]|uniref:DUF3429 domain-containing protein n=1 Tax=Hyphobacterium sp. TaxID=2004662 RepID=UPI003BACC870
MSQRPVLPYVLGIAGLIPFVGLAVYATVLNTPSAAIAGTLLLAYGAVILSFLGGSRWGAEIHRRPDVPSPAILCLAMLPSLTGWAAMIVAVVATAAPAYWLLVLAFVMQMLWDMTAIRNGTFPRWYMPLRIGLTVIVAASLIAAATF